MLKDNPEVMDLRIGFEADASAASSAPIAKETRHDLPEPRRPVAPARDERPSPEINRPRVEAPADGKDHGQEAVKGKGFLRRRPVASAMGALVAAATIGGGYIWWDYAGHFESTDDAFIAARQIAIAPKVAGYVTDVPVTDNQHVAAGGTIARIDDHDYRVQVDQAKAALVFAQQQAARYDELARKGAGSVQNAQQYSSQLDQQQAAVKVAQAAASVAQRQIEALNAQRSSAQASLAQSEAQREQAQLNLSYTNVEAVEPGRVVNLTAAPGEFAQAGTNLTMFVPDEIWVTANFKETQLDTMRPGQPVTLSVDAYPERALRGHVESVQPGSGTAFSLLPAQNATGNYVKIVQRVPVKIVLDNPPKDVALGPGMSVTPSVRVNPAPSLYERLTASFDRLWRKP